MKGGVVAVVGGWGGGGNIRRKVETVNTMEKKKEDATCTSNLASCKEKGVHRRRNKRNVNHLYFLLREGRGERDNGTV
jgi:hypothetical protein